MDVPYNKSGASSREHYRIVRNVENAPHQTEHLIRHEVHRIRQRISGKRLSTSELRKDLVILLYCLSASFGSISSKTLSFALPSAVHLAEAGSKLSEKRIGYLFCWEVMPREHELQLMLVNTVRKDLMSASFSRIDLALESLVNLPSADVVPAVHARCIELLSHPSPRIRVLAMHALQSLAQFAPDSLNDEKVNDLVLKRLSDADESVIRAALKFGLFLKERNLLQAEKMIDSCISLLSRLWDKWSVENYSSGFATSILSAISSVDEKEDAENSTNHANGLLPTVLAVLRRAVKHDQKSLILECFRLLGRFPSVAVAQYITNASSQTPESHHQREGSDRVRSHFVHPVVRIRHFLSSRTVNDHYLFLSCLACLNPSLWAGTAGTSENLLSATDGERKDEGKTGAAPSIPLVLDQLEVERVLSFLESEDEQIRALTLCILISLDPSLVETCYTRALEPLRTSGSANSGSDRARNVLLQRLIELAFTLSLGNEKIESGDREQLLLQKLKEVVDAAGAAVHANGMIVEAVLSRIRRENVSSRHSFILCLLSLLQTDDVEHHQNDAKPLDATLFLILVALICEFASIFASSRPEVVSIVCLLAAMLHTSSLPMQEPLLLCMIRLVALLSPNELSSPEIEDVRRVVHECGEASLVKEKKATLVKRCEQFEKTLANLGGLKELLRRKENISLPEFAFILAQADRRQSPSPKASPTKSLSPPSNASSPRSNFLGSPPLSYSKLRYDAYAAPSPPPTSTRLLRVHSHSSTASNRSSSRASSSRLSDRYEDVELSRTVTAGELTLAVGGNELAKVYKSNNKARTPELDHATGNLSLTDTPRTTALSDLLSHDSPFLPEPLVDIKDISNPELAPVLTSRSTPPPITSSYASASSSLRTSPDPGQNFEILWSEMDEFKVRGWCEGAVDVVVRLLQGLGLRMDVLDADVAPFEGDLKILLYPPSIGSSTPSAVLRLHEEDDGSCLWLARCSDGELGARVEELLK